MKGIKPTYSELSNEAKYERFPVEVVCYRDLGDGNYFFVTDEGEVMDGYVIVGDSGGVPAVTKHTTKSFGATLIRKLISAFLMTKGLVPKGVAKILNLEAQSGKAGSLKEIFSMAKQDLREAAVRVVRDFGMRKARDLIEAASATGFADRDALLAEVERLAEKVK